MRGLSLQNRPVEMGFKRHKNQLSYVDSVVAVIENSWTFRLHLYKNKTFNIVLPQRMYGNFKTIMVKERQNFKTLDAKK